MVLVNYWFKYKITLPYTSSWRFLKDFASRKVEISKRNEHTVTLSYKEIALSYKNMVYW